MRVYMCIYTPNQGPARQETLKCTQTPFIQLLAKGISGD